MKKLLLPILLLLTACSTTPTAIRTAPDPDPGLAEVSARIASHTGDVVRWGGRVIKVENDDNGATIHVAQFPLNSYGRPQIDRDSEGRFLASSTTFIDPYIYKEGTLLTVAGVVVSEQTLTVDKKQLTLPVVRVTALHRWPPRQPVRDPYYWPGYPHYDYFGYGLHYPGPRSYWRYYHGYYW